MEPDLSAGKAVVNPVNQRIAKKICMYRMKAVLELNTTVPPEVIAINKRSKGSTLQQWKISISKSGAQTYQFLGAHCTVIESMFHELQRRDASTK